MLRIAIASFMQESNSFAPRPAVRSDFEVHSAARMIPEFEGTNSEVGGFLEACSEERWQPVPLIAARATSGGVLTKDCFEDILGELLKAAGSEQFDAILLALHGAMSTEHRPSGDAEIVTRLRAEMGSSIPLVITHDLHANVLPELLDKVDGLAGYRTYPHVDQKATGLRAAAILQQILEGHRPRNWQLRIPMLILPHASATFEPPLLPVMEDLARAFPDTNNSCASLFFVQPWLDFVPVSGCLTVTDFSGGEDVPGKMIAVARQLWNLRHDLDVEWTEPEDLASRIARETVRPVVVSEAHDAPSGGASGDHTGLLRCLLPHADTLKACLFLIDPEVAREAARAGVGGRVNTPLGGKVDPRFSAPVEVQANVAHLSDGAFTFRGPAYNGLHVSMGPTATLRIGQISIVVGSRPVFVIDPELFRSQGVDPAQQDVVGVKSPTLFRAAYREISENVLYLNMPGPCSGKLQLLPYRHINRPIFPLDDFAWEPSMSDVRLCGEPAPLRTEANK